MLRTALFLMIGLWCAVRADTTAVTANPVDRIPVADSIKVPVLDFKNTDIRDVLRALGMQYNVNIYIEPDVTGEVSLYLVDVTVKSAIDFIIKRKNFSYVVENGIVKVFKPKEVPPPPPPAPAKVFTMTNGLLTVDVKDLLPQEAARLFSDSANMNVVVEGQPSKTITSHLKDVDPKKALKVMFESSGYSLNPSDGIYYVALQNWGGQAGQEQGNTSRQRLSVTVSRDNRISIEVTAGSLDQVIRSIANQSGINIFIYDQVSGTISARCDSIPLDDALRFLLQNTKFTFWKDKNIYFIGSTEMSEQKTTVVIPLKHIMADEAEITKILPPMIAKDAVIKFDNEHNALIVIGSFDVVARTQEFFEKIDRPVPQVLIEALVVDFNIDKVREFGLSVFTGGLNDSSSNLLSESFLPEIDLKPGRMKTARILNEVLKFMGVDKMVNLPKNFRASIQALETSNVVKVHSTPQIATLNGNAASITIGETRYYKLLKETKAANLNSTSTLGTDERFETVQFNTKLEVTPWVMDDGQVMVKIRPEFNIPRAGGDATKPPNVDTRVIESMVRLRDGQTIVLGGQRQTENIVKGAGVPFLSNIPILGLLFSNKQISKVETQMMIFLTPHIYYGDEAAVTPDTYFGDEMNQMLEKSDPAKFSKRLREKRIHQAKDSTLLQTAPTPKKKWKWPWKDGRKKSSEQRGASSEKTEKIQ
jgi:type II secretory pathway component GspD/PulD (secretin)